ncbi:MAG: hypothetical protein KGL58_09670, partial [Pseudomonadota bacterium]|nr:hypothetical protein [Pseudomonadota bacterium]
LSHPAQIVMLPSLLQQVGDTGQALLVDLEQIADQMNRLLDRQNIRHWSQTLQNLSRATRQLNELEASIAPVVSRLPQTSQQMEQTLRDTDETVRQLGRLSKELGPKLRVLDEVGKAGSQVTQVAQTVHDTTLPEIQALIIRLNHSAIRLDDALRQQQQYPQELLWGRPPVPPGPGEPGFQVKEKE